MQLRAAAPASEAWRESERMSGEFMNKPAQVRKIMTEEGRELTWGSFFFFFFYYLFLAMLGLRCCMWAFSSCRSWGLLFVVVRGLLIAVASLCCGAWALGTRVSVAAARGLSSCGSRALEHRLSSCGARA